MEALLTEHRAQQQDRRTAALAAYATLLRRAGEPQDGDAAALADHMATLGVNDMQLVRDVGAVNRYAALREKRLSDVERAQIQQQGQERLTTVHDAQRAQIAEMAHQLDPSEFFPVFDLLNRMVLIGDNRRGIPNAHFARAEQWKQLEGEEMRATRNPSNQLKEDDDNAAQMAQLRRDHPEAFGLLRE